MVASIVTEEATEEQFQFEQFPKLNCLIREFPITRGKQVDFDI